MKFGLGSIWIGNTKGSIIRFNNGTWGIYNNEKVGIAAQTNVGMIATAKKGVQVFWLSQKDKINNWVWFASKRSVLLWKGDDMVFHLFPVWSDEYLANRKQ
ncbi:MAG: hypothetical protein OEX02_19145 [Cyclobacteriaceae bacterium]|nr:hypothetical protein [Cyclobacteriaceae bacterium]